MFKQFTINEIHEIENCMLDQIDQICKKEGILYYLAYGSTIGALRHKGPIPWDADVDIFIWYKDLDKFAKIMTEQLDKKFYFDFYTNNSKYQLLFPRIGLTGYDSDLLHIDVRFLVGLSNDPSEQKKYFKKSEFLFNLYFAKKNSYYTNKLQRINRSFILRNLSKLFLKFISEQGIINKFNRLCSKYPVENAQYVMSPYETVFEKGVLSKEIFDIGRKVPYSEYFFMIPKESEKFLIQHYKTYMDFPKAEDRNIGIPLNIKEVKIHKTKRVLYIYNKNLSFEDNILWMKTHKKNNEILLCGVQDRKIEIAMREVRIVDDIVKIEQDNLDEIKRDYVYDEIYASNQE